MTTESEVEIHGDRLNFAVLNKTFFVVVVSAFEEIEDEAAENGIKSCVRSFAVTQL